MAHPLSARILLLAAAAALAASLIFAMLVAEQRDIDGRAPAFGGALTELRLGATAAAPVEQLRAIPVSSP